MSVVDADTMDELRAAISAKVGRQNPTIIGASPRMRDYSVPANSPTLRPCYTREMHERITPGMVFDNYGCRIDPLSGWRIPDDCGPPGSEQRKLCLGVSRKIEGDSGQRLAGLVSFVVPLIPNIGPVLGQMLSAAVSDLMGKLGATVGDLLGREFKAFLSSVETWVRDAFKTVESFVRGAAEKTFQILGSAAKTISDVLKGLGNQLDAARLMAYAGVREGLSFAGNLIRADVPSLKTLTRLSSAALEDVRSLGSMVKWADSQKVLAVVQTAADYMRETRGTLDPMAIDNFITANMADLTGGTWNPNQILGKISANPDNPAVKAAYFMAEKYAGKPLDMVKSVSPEQLAAMVPGDARGLFLGNIKAARDFAGQMEPSVKAAEQLTALARDKAQRMLSEPGAFAESALLAGRTKAAELQSLARLTIQTAEDQADEIVRRAAAKIRGVEIPRVNLPTIPDSDTIRELTETGLLGIVRAAALS